MTPLLCDRRSFEHCEWCGRTHTPGGCTGSRRESAEDALRRILSTPNADMIGELLRDQTFVGEGFGCYSNFNVRRDAREWTLDERREFWGSDPDLLDDEHFMPGEREEAIEENARLGSGYSWDLGPFRVDCCWYWDGDGTLCFRVVDSAGEIVCVVENTDCKKDYRWRTWEPA